KVTGSGPGLYSRTLLSFAQATLTATGVCAMADGADELRQRIQAAYRAPRRSRRRTRLLALVVLIASATALTPWQISSENQTLPDGSAPALHSPGSRPAPPARIAVAVAL
ncbi:MAG TPA: hypothetical protein VM328_11270, partial [Fimbriimonadaceae bacterium]|nr:hypothetical protein [Fimbriimonadaceae bacterium]